MDPEGLDKKTVQMHNTKQNKSEPVSPSYSLLTIKFISAYKNYYYFIIVILLYMTYVDNNYII